MGSVLGKGSSPPPAPDYTGAAIATAAGNKDAAIAGTEANRVNQYTPYGSLTYKQTGTSAAGNPLWSATTSLSPEQQKLLDLQNQTSIGLGETMGTGLNYVQDILANPFDTSALPSTPNLPTVQDVPTTNQVTDTLMARQQPMLDRIRSQKETDLMVRGFNPGGEAWKSSQDDLARAENDARMAAVLAGGQEQSRLANVNAQQFGQGAQLFGLGQTARDRALQEQAFLRNEPLNTLNAVRTGAQVTGPTFQNVPLQQGYTGPDLLGATQATGQYNQGTYNAQQAGNNAMMGGLFQLGGQALPFLL